MSKLVLIFKYTLRQMVRERQRVLFVLFSIALGVAVIVSLRTLGWMVQDTFTHNLQAFNKGDVVLTAPNWYQAFAAVGPVDTNLIAGGENPFRATTFSPEAIVRFHQWAESRQYHISLASRNNPPTFVYSDDLAKRLTAAPVYAIDETQYPYYATTTFISGRYNNLADALKGEGAVVVSQALAEALQISPEDTLRITGSAQAFRVTAIVADDNEAGLNSALLQPAYLYLSNRIGQSEFGMIADTIFIQLPDGSNVSQVEEDLEQLFPGLPIFTTKTLYENVQGTSNAITRLVTSLGLLSLLIGGIGVYNTVAVVVRRRTMDIAILKTLGLKNGQITGIFLTEFTMYGLIGSVFGVILGLLLAQLWQRIAAQLFQQTFILAIYPEAIIVGGILGILITVLFSVLPILQAGSVRPMVVLNPNRPQLPSPQAAAYWLTLMAGVLIIGVILGQILGRIVPGFVITLMIVIGLGVAGKLLSLLLQIGKRLPVRQNPYFLLAQRSILINSSRTIGTLLALIIGIFCLGFVVLLAQQAVDTLNDFAAEQYGGDIVVMVETDESAQMVESHLTTVKGIISQERTTSYVGQVVAVNHNRNIDSLYAMAYKSGLKQFGRSTEPQIDEAGNVVSPYQQFDPVAFQLKSVLYRFTLDQIGEAAPGGIPSYPLISGSYSELAGQPAIILQAGSATEWLGLGAGDVLTLAWQNGRESDLIIGGIIGKPKSSFAPRTEYIQVNGLVPAQNMSALVPPSRIAYALATEKSGQQEIVLALSELPGVTVLELAQLNVATTRLMQQLAFIPLVVALLSLFASGVIIANTVTLTMLERYREVGVLKVIGLHTSHLLRLLLIENSMIALLGGAIGVGLGFLGLFIINLVAGSKHPPLAESVVIALLLICVALSVAWTATLAAGWSIVRKPIPTLISQK